MIILPSTWKTETGCLINLAGFSDIFVRPTCSKLPPYSGCHGITMISLLQKPNQNIFNNVLSIKSPNKTKNCFYSICHILLCETTKAWLQC
ncbi:unnamed protein product [Caretta caretta]